jgi:geranylgeranyl pyrophosphate synthase
MLPLDGCLDPRLRAVVEDVLGHPGSLARAQLAFGLGVRRGLDAQSALEIAIATEYFHSASLLFDDMPSMDDALERRGHPCPHVVHGEAAAILGALALITRAYTLLWEGIGESRLAAAALVDECLGVAGILDGQARDVHFRREGASATAAEAAAEVAMAKTVPLIRLALVLPALVAGEGAATLDRLERLAVSWGLSYQILDDFKDRLMGPEETGKTAERDARLGRPNLPALAGPRTAFDRLRRRLAESRAILRELDDLDELDATGGTGGTGGGWAPLERLQGFLETEASDVARRLEGMEGAEAA